MYCNKKKIEKKGLVYINSCVVFLMINYSYVKSFIVIIIMYMKIIWISKCYRFIKFNDIDVMINM